MKFLILLCAMVLATPLYSRAAVATNSTLTATNTPGAALTNAYPLKIVTCHDDVDVDALLAEFQIQLSNPKHHLRNMKMFFALLDDAMIQKLKSDPRVVAVEADGPVSLAGQTDTAGLRRMGIPQFPPARINGTTEPIDVDVAILDSGVGPHEDLNVFTNYSVYDENAYDLGGHGTSVAGVLGALDNDIGVVGVAPGVRIWNVQCSGPPPNNSWTYLNSGMGYVLQHADKISVVNISISNEMTNAPTSSIRAAVRNLVRNGVVVVVGAGNIGWDLAGPDQVYGTGDDALPASSPHAMAVSGMDASVYVSGGPPRDQLWPSWNFSQVERENDVIAAYRTNYVISSGRSIDVAAPGVYVLTTATNNGYDVVSGTSVAAPHVAGLVALYIVANGRATNEWGVYRIRQAIVDHGLPQSQWHTNNTLDPDTNPEPLAIASEAWVPKPVITNFAGAPGNFAINFATIPGYDYTVQSTTNLTSPIPWENLRTVSGSSNVMLASVTDTNVADQSFYRLERQASGGAPPVITVPPVSDWAKLPGTTLNLSVLVSGTPPFSYLWQKDGSPLADGGTISGAATPSLVLTNLQLPDAGAYRVVVTNASGSVTSTVATVTILTNWTSAVVTGVLATATSEIGFRPASGVVDGVYPDPSPWESVGVDQGFGVDRAPAITFDLGTVRRVENTAVWNGSEQPASVKRMVIEVSNDGVSFSPLGEFTLTLQPPAWETLSLGGVICRFVRFTVRENGAGQLFPVPVTTTTVLGGGFAELDEVEFHEYQGD